MSSPVVTFKRPALKKKPPPAQPAPEGTAAPAPAAAAAAAPDASIKPVEERAAEARKQFEREAEALLRAHVLDSPDELASFDFVPTERPWRDVLHDVAAGMGLYSETVEDADGERHKPLPGSRHEIEQLKMQTRMQVPGRSAARRVDDAPPPAEAVNSVVKLNVNKRDLRTIEEVQHEMAARKAPKTETATTQKTDTGGGAT